MVLALIPFSFLSVREGLFIQGGGEQAIRRLGWIGDHGFDGIVHEQIWNRELCKYLKGSKGGVTLCSIFHVLCLFFFSFFFFFFPLSFLRIFFFFFPFSFSGFEGSEGDCARSQKEVE